MPIKMDADFRQIEGTTKYKVDVKIEERVTSFEAESWQDACARIEAMRQEVWRGILDNIETNDNT